MKYLGGEGVEQRALFLKQIRSLGCRTWLDKDEESKFCGLHIGDGDKLPSYFHVRFFIFGTDQGPDQVSAYSSIEAECKDDLLLIICNTWCIRHVLHLIFKRHIALLERYKYVSKLAMIVNTWRSLGIAAKIYAEWEELYGDAASFLRKLIPRCLRGRWGSVTKVQDYLLACGKDKLERVWKRVVVDKHKHRGTDDDDGHSLGEIHLTLLASFTHWPSTSYRPSDSL